MTPAHLGAFRDIWGVDCEFHAPDGERPQVICLIAKELRSGRVIRLGRDELMRRRAPPYAIDRHSLFVAYYASAEMSCHPDAASLAHLDKSVARPFETVPDIRLPRRVIAKDVIAP